MKAKPSQKANSKNEEMLSKSEKRKIEAILASFPAILKTNPGKAYSLIHSALLGYIPGFRSWGIPPGERRSDLGRRCLKAFLEGTQELVKPGAAIKYGIAPIIIADKLNIVMDWSVQLGGTLAAQAKKLAYEADRSLKLHEEEIRKKVEKKLHPKVKEWIKKGRPNIKKKDCSKKELLELESTLARFPKILKANPLKALNLMYATLCLMPRKILRRKIGGFCILAFGDAIEALTPVDMAAKYDISPEAILYAANDANHWAIQHGDGWLLSETRNVDLRSEIRSVVHAAHALDLVHEARKYKKRLEEGFS